MKPIIIKNSRVPKWLSVVENTQAITIWPFIFLANDGTETLVRHETTHIRQYNELFVLGFYLVYLYDFIHGYYIHRNTYLAYKNTRFEQEAYDNENTVNYLDCRKRYSWKEYKVV